MTPDARSNFIQAHTRLKATPLCPEIVLHTVDAFTALWQTQEQQLIALGIDTPFWALPWAGGQALARYVLDNGDAVAGKTVLDLGCGSAIAALAAAKSGARHVIANDPDPLALRAAAMNAHNNHVALECRPGDLLRLPPPTDVEVFLAADLWFDCKLGQRVTDWLGECRATGAEVLIGDPFRAYLPYKRLLQIGTYSVATSTDIERHENTRTGVFRMH